MKRFLKKFAVFSIVSGSVLSVSAMPSEITYSVDGANDQKDRIFKFFDNKISDIKKECEEREKDLKKSFQLRFQEQDQINKKKIDDVYLILNQSLEKKDTEIEKLKKEKSDLMHKVEALESALDFWTKRAQQLGDNIESLRRGEGNRF